MFPVAEKFVSINGEASHAGELAAFIRFRGCNLCCSYCDTRWANEADAKAEDMTDDELTEWVLSTGVKNVTLTGGEPLLQENIQLLTDKLITYGCRVEIETNGSVSVEKLAKRELRPVFTLDYKLPSSGMESSMLTDNYKYLKSHDTVKFVAGTEEDLERAARIISRYKLTEKCHVYISPVYGNIDPARIVDFMIEHGMNGVRIQLQLHKFIWDPERRGV